MSPSETQTFHKRSRQAIPTEKLARLIEHARLLSNAQRGAIFLFDDPSASTPAKRIECGARSIRDSLHNTGAMEYLLSGERTVRMNNTRTDSRLAPHPLAHLRPRTLLSVQLRVDGHLAGLCLLADKKDSIPFSPWDAQLLEVLAEQAEAIIEVADYAVAEARERRMFNAMLQQAAHGIMFFAAPAGEIVFINAAALNFVGQPVVGNEPMADHPQRHGLYWPDGSICRPEALPAGRALLGEIVTNERVDIYRPDNVVIPLLVSASPVYSDDNTLLGAVAVMQDNSASIELDRLREEFSAVVAHDLRNPIQVLKLEVAILKHAAHNEEVVLPRSDLLRLERASNQLTTLVDDLSNASLVAANRVNVDLKPTSLATVVSTTLSNLSLTLGTRPVEVHAEYDPDLVMADASRLDQILSNLILNAAKYSPPETTIAITIKGGADGSSISVQDAGFGISAKELPKLFDRFYQTKRARAQKDGLGLGLYITKGLVEAQHGRIEVESTPGVGSTFTVWLPNATRCQNHPTPF